MVTTTEALPAEHPARLASQRSIAAVQAKDKDAWLALFADDAVVEDPVGRSFLDESGLGHRGKEAIGAFFDNNIATVEQIRFELHDSFATGDEVANVATIHMTLPGGTTSRCEGVFVYRVRDDGKLVSLRAYWEVDRMMATMTQA
ncbi:MAG: nuclear transport factor 2 family protein [Frankiaceae bacterium]|nr:nuclear transport factor 2 family protein [Frankiaceae bacterium]